MTELSAEQQRLLAARLGGTKPARRPEKPPDIPRHDADAPPLSAGQQALLFEYHRRSDEPVYTVSYSYWIEGPFDADRFIEALRIVVMAHEPLHTGFGSDRRVLTVEEALKVEQVQLDEAAFAATAERRAKRRVDIEHGPLVHALVGQLAGDRHGVVLTMHHISCDAGSLAAFWADLNVAYRGEELPERAVCYADHAVWQRSRVTDDDLQHWIEQLGAEPEVAELSFARPSAGTLNGYVRRQLTVNDAEVGALGTRPFPLFLAAYGVLLQHLGDVAEPTVGVVASTRDHPDTEPLVGYFLAVLPFRLPVGSSTFRCLVDAVETLSAAGLARRHVPFAQIVQRLRDRKIVTDLAHTMFVFDEVHEPQLDGVRIESRVHSNGTAVAPITLFVRRWGAGWEVALEFDGSELDETSAKLFLDCFDIALSKLLANPDQPVNALNFSDGQASELDMIGQPVTAPVLPLCELIVDHGDTQPL
ncbi:MAG: condensation domain-containing protein, partial [Acidimicrobiales bacterium]